MTSYFKLLIATFLVSLSQNTFSLLVPFLIYEYTQSYDSMNLIRAFEYLPSITIVLFIGAIVDRYGWQKNLFISTLIQGTMILGIAALIYIRLYNSYAFLLLLFIITSMTILFNNARVCAIKYTIEKNNLHSANSSLQATLQISQVIAPALLSGLMMLTHMYYGLILCAVILLLSCAMTYASDKAAYPPNPPNPPNYKSTFLESFAFIKSQKDLLKLSLVALLINAIESSQIILYIYQAKSVFHLSNINLTLILAGLSLIIIITCKIVEKYHHLVLTKKAFYLSFVCCALLYLLCYLKINIVLLSITLLISNMTFAILAIYIWSYRLYVSPTQIAGKIIAITSMIFKLGIPAIMLFSIVLANYYNYHLNYLIFMLFCLISASLVFTHIPYSEPSDQNRIIKD